MRSKMAIYNIIFNLFLQIIAIIYGFVVPKIIISNFGSNVNGLITSITKFLAYITLLESGFGPVVKSILYKLIAKNDIYTITSILKSTEKFFRTIAYIFIGYIIILCIIYPLLVSKEFEYIYTVSLIIIIAISTFAEYFFGMTYRLFLQANQKNYIVSIIQTVIYIFNIFIVIVLVKFNFNIQIIKLVSGLIFTLRPLLQNYYVKKKYKINLNMVNAEYKIEQKWDGLAQHIASVIHNNTDITLLTLFSNLTEVSIYAVYNLVLTGVKSIIQSFINGIDAVFGDMIAKNERKNLNLKFNVYENLYNVINTIIFSCTLVLIVPFISVYTKNVTDANYIRYTFGVLIVISEYIWAIRQPYNELVKAAGHFKETRIGAWVECLSNIIISIILVNKYEIIGVTIGTIVAMTIRTIEFVYHTNKYILNRSIFISIKKILLVIIETILIVLFSKFLPMIDNTSYINWVINSCMVLLIACLIVFVMNYIFYKNEFKEIFKILKNIFKRRKKNAKN